MNFLNLQLLTRRKPPKGLYVYGDVGKFHKYNFKKYKFEYIAKCLQTTPN